jgi:8-oxo-dGTP pyrophosphatase MutT (NUDIX family)
MSEPDSQPASLLASLLAGRSPVAPPPDLAQAAVAVVLRFDRPTDVLLMQRAERAGDRWSGQVSLPGGHVDPGDADALACAVRETREELGLDLDAHGRYLGRLDAIQARARGGLLPLWITPVVFAQERDEGGLVLSHEAAGAFRLPLAPVLAGDLDADFPYDRGDAVFQLPSWRYDGRTIWGLTHRILSGLFDVAGPQLDPHAD